MKKQNIMQDADKILTKDDYGISMTTLMLKDYQKALELLDQSKINNILDLGCGFGGLTKLVANFVSSKEAWGIDIDSERLNVAESRGLRTIKADIEKDELPFSSDYFDLIISNGVIEHLHCYDNLISESYRTIRKGGYFLLSWPNLGSFTQRISLLLGYQPNDLEISRKLLVGTIYYPQGRGKSNLVGHITCATVKAMKQLLEYFGFTIVGVKRGNPKMMGKYSNWAPLIRTIGSLCPVSMARRPIIIAKK